MINVLEWEPENPAEENMQAPVVVGVWYDGKKVDEEIVIGASGQAMRIELNRPEAMLHFRIS